MHRILKKRDRALDAVFFAMRAVLLVIGLVAAYIGTNNWSML